MLYTKKKTFNYFYNKKNGQPISGQDKLPSKTSIFDKTILTFLKIICYFALWIN
jgi:hypothetical protein